jgi:hypothetical protein
MTTMSRAGNKITGNRYGKLVAIKRGTANSRGAYHWLYRCDCGATVERMPATVAKSARIGTNPMCRDCRYRNDYRIVDGAVHLDVSTKTHPAAKALIDLEDLKLTLDTGGRWHAARGPNGLIYVTQKNGGYLHRLLMAHPDGLEVDHISGDTLDNRRSTNLRSVTNSENRRNTRVSSRNKTGVVGVFVHQNRFGATIVNQYGRQISIGSFDTLEQASMARKEAEVKHGYHENHGRPA